GLQGQSEGPGRFSARFYAINSLGAVCGAGLAGFYLVREWGLVASLQMAGMVNLLIGATAIVLSRHQNEPAPIMTGNKLQPSIAIATEIVHAQSFRWAALLVATTGGISMGLEVLASRSLALIFGSSLQSFAVVLIAFIFGIGIGSTIISAQQLRTMRNERLVAGLLVGAALWIGLLVFQIESWAHVY